MKNPIQLLKTAVMAVAMLVCSVSAWADDAVASVTFDGTTTNYSDFADAITAANSAASTAENPAVVTLLQNHSCVGVKISEGKYIIFSTGSYTMYLSEVVVNGYLTIKDGTYKASAKNHPLLFNVAGSKSSPASLTVNGGTIDATSESTTKYAIGVQTGTCIINGGTIKGNDYALYLNSEYTPTATLNGGTFYGETSISCSGCGYSLSSILGSEKAYYINGNNGWERCTDTSGVTFNNTVYVGNNNNVAKVSANGTETIYDTFDKAITAANAAGTATVTMLSDCSTDQAVIPSGKNITLNGGSNTLTTTDCIHVDGNLTINDGTYVSTTTGTVSCINVQSGSLTLNGGTFSGHGGSIEVFGKTVLSALGDGKLYYDGDDLYNGNLLSEYISKQVTVKDAGSYAAVVYTGKANIGYETFADALSNALLFTTSANPYKIVLLKDCETAGFEAPADKGFAIYGNKHTMTLTDKVQVRGDLIIGDGTFKADNWNPSDTENTDELFDVTGTLTIEGGVIDANNVLNKALETDGTGGVKINGGTIQGANNYALYINNASTGTVLSGGSFSGYYGAIRVPSPMPVCYLLRYGATFQDYSDDFFASETSSSVNIVVGDILYKRDVTSGNYGSICLPYYSGSQSGIEAVYEVASVSADNVELYEAYNWGNGYEMEAGTPYIFKSNSSSICINLNSERVTTPVANDYLVGNFYAMTGETYVPVGNYVLQNNSFKKVTSATADDHIYSGAYRCYLNGSKVPQSQGVKANVLNLSDESETTAIDALNAVLNNEAAIYDINGRRLNALQKGINIVNGKKITVK